MFATDHKWETALHLSAESGAEASVRILLSQGAEINLDAKGRTPLHRAIESGHPNSIRIMYRLVEAGASINPTERRGDGPVASGRSSRLP